MDFGVWARVSVLTALAPLLCALFSWLEKKGHFSRSSYKRDQALIGVAFGIVAIISTECGVPVDDGAIINVRDAAPVCAGLFFGAPAGIIAGVIGGVERWLCVYWGGALYTRLACSLGTFIAGVVAAFLRTHLFDDRRPPLGYTGAIGMTSEVVHMLLILVTNMDDLNVAFSFVEECAVPMIVAVGVSVFLASMACGRVRRDSVAGGPPNLINDLALRLFAVIATTFLIVSGFTYRVNMDLTYSQANELLSLNLTDITGVADGAGWGQILGRAANWRIDKSGGVVVTDANGRILTTQDHGKKFLPEDMEDEDAYEAGRMTRATLFGTSCFVMKSTEDISNGSGRTAIVYVPVSEVSFFSEVSMYLVVFMEIIVHFALFILLYSLMRNRVVEKLDDVNAGLRAISEGDLDIEIDVRSHKEFSNLSDDINQTVTSLKNLTEDAKRRMEDELATANQIQHNALPSVFPAFPDRQDFHLFASMDAAKEVGGDFYDFYLVNSRTLVFMIADVSGKGVPGAMFMMRAKTQIKSLVESGKSVEKAFTAANEILCEGNEAGMFVTAWIGVLDLGTGELSYANAGHNPPIIRRRGQKAEYLRTKANLFLGGMEGIQYGRQTLRFDIGDEIFLYTDGITEAVAADDEFYGEDRLLACINASDRTGPKGVCERVLADVRAFSEGAEQADDITMLCVRLNALTEGDVLTFLPETRGLEIASDFLERRLRRAGLVGKPASRVQVVADEIISNIIRYSQATRAVVSFERAGGELTLIFADDGKPFDPTAASDADTSLSAEERKIGGLGIHMVRRMTRSMTYQRIGDENILMLEFAHEE